MAKTTGLGDRLYIGGYDLSGDVGEIKGMNGGPKALEVTGIRSSAPERLGGERDGAIKFGSFFNPGALAEHVALSPLPTADTLVTYGHGAVLGNEGACLWGKQINYDFNRANDGALILDIEAQANAYGLEWGEQLTAGLRTDTTATNGTALDYTTVSTAFGWQAYLQVTAFAGTSVTVKLQDSADNGTFADLASGAFTAVSAAPAFQRIAGGATDTVRRYVRVATTGTFSSATFIVVFVKNALQSVVF